MGRQVVSRNLNSHTTRCTKQGAVTAVEGRREETECRSTSRRGRGECYVCTYRCRDCGLGTIQICFVIEAETGTYVSVFLSPLLSSLSHSKSKMLNLVHPGQRPHCPSQPSMASSPGGWRTGPMLAAGIPSLHQAGHAPLRGHGHCVGAVSHAFELLPCILLLASAQRAASGASPRRNPCKILMPARMGI